MGERQNRIGWDYTDARIRGIVIREWMNLYRDFINELTASMPRRLAAVIAASGGNERAVVITQSYPIHFSFTGESYSEL